MHGIFVAEWKVKVVGLPKNGVFGTDPNRELVRVNAKTLLGSLPVRF